MLAWTVHGRLALISLVVGGAVLADGSIQSAGAQCAPGRHIYIDPRLVPQRQHMSYDQVFRLLSTPGIPDNVRNWALESYYSQNQPIQVPFRGGTVLVSPTDPCIQQYIGQ
jgi:hypothetical protein